MEDPAAGSSARCAAGKLAEVVNKSSQYVQYCLDIASIELAAGRLTEAGAEDPSDGSSTGPTI